MINNAPLIPMERPLYVDARLYYVFRTTKNSKIFEVIMWGNNGCIIVNGKEVYDNDVFYDIVVPFMPEDAAKVWGAFSEK
jgi:hypothetical protein